MSDQPWRVLVPVEVLEGESLPDAVIDVLATLPVVVLGYHVLPEQTAPGQARIQFEDRAQASLDDIAAAFREAGRAVDTRLVFTHDEEQTLDRVADETGCDAILIPNPSPDIERILVPLRGEVDVERIAAFVAALIGGRDIDVTLFEVVDGDVDPAAGGELVDAAASHLREGGLPAASLTGEVTASATPLQAITDAAADHDAVVMGEREPSLQSFLFGEIAEQVAAHTLGPVIVVRAAASTVE